ncbi:hypothetical protein CR513_34018, partial [Mucuna pruriens]
MKRPLILEQTWSKNKALSMLIRIMSKGGCIHGPRSYSKVGVSKGSKCHPKASASKGPKSCPKASASKGPKSRLKVGASKEPKSIKRNSRLKSLDDIQNTVYVLSMRQKLISLSKLNSHVIGKAIKCDGLFCLSLDSNVYSSYMYKLLELKELIKYNVVPFLDFSNFNEYDSIRGKLAKANKKGPTRATEVENQYGKRIKIVRSYRCGEFYDRHGESVQLKGLFAKYLEDCRIVSQFTMPQTL